MNASELVTALDSTFRIIGRCLDTWTLDMLDEEIRRTFGDDEVGAHARRGDPARVAHDVYHCAEVNETLAGAGLPLIDPWE
jgi:hypothetical protein